MSTRSIPLVRQSNSFSLAFRAQEASRKRDGALFPNRLEIPIFPIEATKR
jgi:hypothetical protein